MKEHSSRQRARLTAAAGDAGRRLDLFLAQHFPEISRTRVQELIREGCVLVQGRMARASHRVSAGEVIEAVVLPRPSTKAEPENLPIDLLRVDDEFVVINKPAGMVVHAGAGHTQGTLVNALLHHLKGLSGVGGPLRPGIVHRLDKDTSGVLVVARTDAAHETLAEQFRTRNVRKIYVALVHGKLPRDSGTIALPIARDPHRRTRMTTRIRAGRSARTDWRVVIRFGGYTLVEIALHTGRTHQIRTHFAAISHPVVGDTLYGASRSPRAGGRILPLLGRNFLHAARIGFLHPAGTGWVEERAPLPDELQSYLMEIAGAEGCRLRDIDAALSSYL